MFPSNPAIPLHVDNAHTISKQAILPTFPNYGCHGQCAIAHVDRHEDDFIQQNRLISTTAVTFSLGLKEEQRLIELSLTKCPRLQKK